MARSSVVESRLWHIFTFYALHGDPLNPNHMNSYQFLRFARECRLISKTLRLADVQVTFAAEVTKKSNEIKRSYDDKSGSQGNRQHGMLRYMQGKNNNTSRRLLSYTGFLNALVELSKKAYPKIGNIQESFEKLLHDKVLAFGSYRKPVDISPILSLPSVRHLYIYYEKPIYEIFQFYATTADGGTSKADSASLADDSSSYARHAANSMKESVDYQDFLKFSQDFNFLNVLLSTLEIADIYLSSIPKQHPNGALRKLTYEMFWECLVRCSLVAYDKVCDESPENKIKGMFLFMWRALQAKVPRAIELRRDVSVYSGDLLAGAMCFNNRFTAQWREDGYKDYLSPGTQVQVEGKGLLKRLLRASSTHQYLEESLRTDSPPAKEPPKSRQARHSVTFQDEHKT